MILTNPIHHDHGFNLTFYVVKWKTLKMSLFRHGLTRDSNSSP